MKMPKLLKKFLIYCGFVEDPDSPSRDQLDEDIKKLRIALDKQAEASSYSMARVGEIETRIQKEMVLHKKYSEEAKILLAEGKEDAVRRCIELKQGIEKRIEELRPLYISLKTRAESDVQAYMDSKKIYEEKKSKVFELKDDIRLIEMEEKMNSLSSGYSFDALVESLDNVEKNISFKRKHIDNKKLLTSDPNKAIDAEIEKSFEKRSIDAEFEALKLELNGGSKDNKSSNLIEDTKNLIKS